MWFKIFKIKSRRKSDNLFWKKAMNWNVYKPWLVSVGKSVMWTNKIDQYLLWIIKNYEYAKTLFFKQACNINLVNGVRFSTDEWIIPSQFRSGNLSHVCSCVIACLLALGPPGCPPGGTAEGNIIHRFKNYQHLHIFPMIIDP